MMLLSSSCCAGYVQSKSCLFTVAHPEHVLSLDAKHERHARQPGTSALVLKVTDRLLLAVIQNGYLVLVLSALHQVRSVS